MITDARCSPATPSRHVAAVLQREPDPTTLPRDTPVAVRKLLQRCLEKDREKRLDSAAGARLGIDEAIAAPADTLEPAATPRRRIPRAAIAEIAGGAATAVLVAWAVMRPTPPVAPILPPVSPSSHRPPGL